MFVRLSDVLTCRKPDVFELLAEGRMNAEIAAWLGRSEQARLQADSPPGATVKTVLLGLRR